MFASAIRMPYADTYIPGIGDGSSCCTPSRKRNTPCASALVRGPGKITPVRFSGSARAISISSPCASVAAQVAQQLHRFRTRELFARESGDEPSAAHFAASLPLPQHHQQTAPRRRQRFARQHIAEHHAPAVEQHPRVEFDVGSRSASFENRPPPRRMPWTRHPPAPLAAPPLGIDQRPQILEAVRGDAPAGHQLPQSVLHFARQTPGGAHQVVEERSPALFERRQHILRRVRPALLRLTRRRQQSRRVFAQKNSQRSHARRPHLAAPLRFERRMRRQPPPHHLARQAQAVQPFGIVLVHAPRQHRRFPRGGGNFVTLQLLENLVQAIDAMQSRARTQMLPAAQEAHEVGGADRLDLAPQTSQRLPVNARQNAAMTKFVIRCR